MGISIWWVLKVLSGLSLISYTLAVYGRGIWIKPFIELPIYVGQIVIFIGASISLIHYAFLKKTAKDFSKPIHLVTHIGLFKFIRHPMYFGDFLFMSGFFLMVGDWIALIMMLSGWISLSLQCKIEDQVMRVQFGEDHEKWQKQSKLLIPWLF